MGEITVETILASLPGMPTGEGWVWAPGLEFLKRVKFPLAATLDTGNPEVQARKRFKLAPIDLAAVHLQLETVKVDAKANNPKELKAALAKANRRITELEARPKAQADPADLQRQYDLGHADGRKQAARGIAKIAEDMSKSVGRAETACADVRRLLDSFATFIDTQAEAIPGPLNIKKGGQVRLARPPAPVGNGTTVGAKPAARTSCDYALTGPQLNLLTALAWWMAMGHNTPTRTQLAAKAGWKAKGSNLRNRLAELSTLGLVEYPGAGTVRLTEAGFDAAPEPDTRVTLLDSIRGVLTGPQTALFEVMVKDAEDGGTSMERAELAESVGWEPGGSNLRNRLAELSAMEIVEYPSRGSVQLQDWVTEALR